MKMKLDAFQFPHPFEKEIKGYEPQAFQEVLDIHLTFPESLKKTPFKFVKEKEELEAMIKILSQENEIAVDLEHHSTRSFLGLTSLMQVQLLTKPSHGKLISC